jgi:hypothetical protein
MADEIVEALEQQIAVGATHDAHADSLGHPVHRELGVVQHRLLDRFGVEDEDEGLLLVDPGAAHPRPGFDHRRAAGVEDEWRMALDGDAFERFQARDECEHASHARRQIVVEIIRPLAAVYPSSRSVPTISSVLRAIDLKGGLCDARIAQRNHRL